MSTTSGTRPRNASTTAGARFTAAVPEVQRTATGRPARLASPGRRSRRPARRGRTRVRIPGWAWRARASGVDRDPGQMTASRVPARTSSSTKARERVDDPGGRRQGLAHDRNSPSAEAMTCILFLDSSHSRAESESATMPQPAKSAAAVPETTAQRSATTNSPSPSAPTQPSGPAYQPRSKPSCSAMSRGRGRAARPRPPASGGSSPARLRMPARSLRRPGHRGHEMLNRARRWPPPATGATWISDATVRALVRACPRRSRAPRGPCRSPAARGQGRLPGRVVVVADRPGDGDRLEVLALGRDEALGVAPRKTSPPAGDGVCRRGGGAGRQPPYRGDDTIDFHRRIRSRRRARTTLSSRPRPTAPAKRSTRRSQVGRSGRSPAIVSGARPPPVRLAAPAPVARASRSAQRSCRRSGAPAPSAFEIARLVITDERGREPAAGARLQKKQLGHRHRGRAEGRPGRIGGRITGEAEAADQQRADGAPSRGVSAIWAPARSCSQAAATSPKRGGPSASRTRRAPPRPW